MEKATHALATPARTVVRLKLLAVDQLVAKASWLRVAMVNRSRHNAKVRLAMLLFSLIGLASVAAAPGSVKLAFFNIQSGKGEVGLPGRPVLFTDTQNCSDTTQPVNAWGVGLVQRELVKAIKNDPAVIALGLGEAWLCGSPENVRQLLGWAAKTSTRNGLAVVARYGSAGPDAWLQLDTSRNPNPKDTMWVVRVPVCAEASCRTSVLMYLGPLVRHRSRQAGHVRQAGATDPGLHGANGWQRTTRADRRSERVGGNGAVRPAAKYHGASQAPRRRLHRCLAPDSRRRRRVHRHDQSQRVRLPSGLRLEAHRLRLVLAPAGAHRHHPLCGSADLRRGDSIRSLRHHRDLSDARKFSATGF